MLIALAWKRPSLLPFQAIAQQSAAALQSSNTGLRFSIKAITASRCCGVFLSGAEFGAVTPAHQAAVPQQLLQNWHLPAGQRPPESQSGNLRYWAGLADAIVAVRYQAVASYVG